MIIKCPECGSDVSNQAPACPHCGKPIAGSNVNITSFSNQPLKIEPVLTSKTWKRVKLIAWLVILGGFMIGGALVGADPNAPYLGFGIAFLGAVTLIVGHVGAWYADKRTR